MDIQNFGYIIVTDYINIREQTDVSDAIQKLIDNNPNRTIYFPDGTYILEKPVLTPADPHKSVDLQLSNFAVIKASENWSHSEALIRLGASFPANNIYTPGSNYGINGGIIDCSGKAKAISIDGGRETYIRNLNIKNSIVGIHIKHGANSGSSDADIHSVNITGTGTTESIGVLIDGYDNTLTNMRIANVFTGIKINSGGNMLRNIHPLFTFKTPEARDEYEKSIGFYNVNDTNNWFDYCYSDQFSVAFKSEGGNFHNCFAWWYSNKEKRHIALKSDKPFRGRISNLSIGGAYHPESENKFMEDLNLSEYASVRDITIDNVPLNI